MNLDSIKKSIEKELQCAVTEAAEIGHGASAKIYRLRIDKEPFIIAAKCCEYPDLLLDEYNTLDFISQRVNCKLPKLYGFLKEAGFAVLLMEYIEGKSAAGANLSFKRGKKKLADEIVDNLLKIHSVHNDKFGPVDNAVYDTWLGYYGEFARGVYDFSRECRESGKVPDIVFRAVELSFENLGRIIEENSEKPSLIHGDYWAPNFLVDTKTMSLAGIVDPFNVMWTEPEYELFALTVGYGKNLRLYERYKKKVRVSRFCDMKIELYALYNELFWFKKLGKVGVGYLVYRSRRLLRQMKKNGIIWFFGAQCAPFLCVRRFPSLCKGGFFVF